MDKESDALHRWNKRHLRIFSDRIEWGKNKGHFLQLKTGKGKSPVTFDSLESFCATGEIGLLLNVREGPADTVHVKTFRCTSPSQRAAILRALEEIVEATSRATAELEQAVEVGDVGPLIRAMEEASKYAIDLRDADSRLQGLLRGQTPDGHERRTAHAAAAVEKSVSPLKAPLTQGERPNVSVEGYDNLEARPALNGDQEGEEIGSSGATVVTPQAPGESLKTGNNASKPTRSPPMPPSRHMTGLTMTKASGGGDGGGCATSSACSSFRVDVKAATFGLCFCGAPKSEHSEAALPRATEYKQRATPPNPDSVSARINSLQFKVKEADRRDLEAGGRGQSQAHLYRPAGHRMEPQAQKEETRALSANQSPKSISSRSSSNERGGTAQGSP